MKLDKETKLFSTKSDDEEDSKDEKGAEDATPSTIEGETKAAAFLLEPVNGTVYKTALWLNKTGFWHVKARGTFYLGKEGELPLLPFTETSMSNRHDDKLHEIDRHLNRSALTQVRY